MKHCLIALALAAALPMSAQASTVSHNFAEVGYLHTSVLDEALNGFDFKVQTAIGDDFYGLGTYSHAKKDNVDIGAAFPIDLKYTSYAIGLGYRRDLSSTTEWNAEASYVREDLDESANVFGAGGVGANGYRVATGLRSMLGSNFEGNAYVNYTDVSDFGSGVGAGIGGVFQVNDTWGITAGYEYGERDDTNISSWNVGVRASY